MTTLDEMLALLPDNTTGAIQASDLRSIVTTLWEEGVKVEARLTSVELESNGGALVTLSGIWTVNPTAGGTPSTQNNKAEVTCDTGDFDTATWLRFDPTEKGGVDLTNAILAATAIFAQQKSDSTNWVRYSVQSAAVVGTYIQVEVTVLGDSGGVTGAAAWSDAIVVFGGIPAGGVGA